MSGREEGVRKAWELSKKTITTGDISDFDGNMCLGCIPKPVDIPGEDVNYKHDQYSRFQDT